MSTQDIFSLENYSDSSDEFIYSSPETGYWDSFQLDTEVLKQNQILVQDQNSLDKIVLIQQCRDLEKQILVLQDDKKKLHDQYQVTQQDHQNSLDKIRELQEIIQVLQEKNKTLACIKIPQEIQPLDQNLQAPFVYHLPPFEHPLPLYPSSVIYKPVQYPANHAVQYTNPNMSNQHFPKQEMFPCEDYVVEPSSKVCLFIQAYLWYYCTDLNRKEKGTQIKQIQMSYTSVRFVFSKSIVCINLMKCRNCETNFQLLCPHVMLHMLFLGVL